MQDQAVTASSPAATTVRPLILGAAAVGLAVALLVPSAFSSTAARNKPLDPACSTWDAAAGAAVTGLAGDASGVSAQRVNEAMFRLKRARRNCQEGWVSLACQDYQAVIRGIEVIDGRRRLPTSGACSATVFANAPR